MVTTAEQLTSLERGNTVIFPLVGTLSWKESGQKDWGER